MKLKLFFPDISPFCLAGKPESLLAGACDGFSFYTAGRSAQRQLNVPAVLPGMAYDARSFRWRALPAGYHV